MTTEAIKHPIMIENWSSDLWLQCDNAFYSKKPNQVKQSRYFGLGLRLPCGFSEQKNEEKQLKEKFRVE